MFACASPGCQAKFYSATSRTGHIKTFHPGEHSGPSPDTIALARIRPELAEHLGMSKEEVFAPQNVREFEEQQKHRDLAASQARNEQVLRNHPAFPAISEAIGHVHALEASALATSPANFHGDIKETADRAHQHLLQFGYGHATGESLRDPYKHLTEAHSDMHQLVDYTQDGMSHVDEGPYHHVDRLVNSVGKKAWGHDFEIYE
jgi:hypothetical protein